MTAVTGGRILVVDDDALLRGSVADVLRDEGYEVEHASDGVEALDRIAAAPPDVILLDLLMPRMNGKQLLQTLHDDPATAGIPVLMMTALHGFEAYRTTALGAADVVEKPFDAEELLNKIALAVYRARSRRPAAPAATLPPPATDAPVESRGVVLVVDEDRDVVAAFDRRLARLGYTIVSLSQPSDELRRLARVLEPRAILLDLRLPADGPAALDGLRALRAEPSLDQVPILVFAASYRELERRRGEIEALGAAWLAKGKAVEEIERFLADPPPAARPAVAGHDGGDAGRDPAADR